MPKKTNIGEAVEVTTFKLTAGHTGRDFVAANAEVDGWLAKQPGFRSRRIAEREDGTIVDILIWAGVQDGRMAAARLMVELADSPVHGMIDQGTVMWTVSPVLHLLQ